MKVLFLGRRNSDKKKAIESLLNKQINSEEGTTVYVFKSERGEEIEIWDIDSLNAGFGEAYCIGADACVTFDVKYFTKKRVQDIAPKAKIHKYYGVDKLKKIIDTI
jgi:uncharacterized Fe-S cluster protein YjdI